MSEIQEVDKLDVDELDSVVNFFIKHPSAFCTVVDKVEENKRRILKDDDLLRLILPITTIRVNSSVLPESVRTQYDEIVAIEANTFVKSTNKKLKDLFSKLDIDDVFPPEYKNSENKEFRTGHGEIHVVIKKTDVGK